MRGVSVVILLAVVAHGHSNEPGTNYMGNTQDSVDTLVDKLVDMLAGKLLQPLKMSPLHQTDRLHISRSQFPALQSHLPVSHSPLPTATSKFSIPRSMPIAHATRSAAVESQVPREDILKALEGVQSYFVKKLEAIKFQKNFKASKADLKSPAFKPVSWLRDEGVHGGGTRMEAAIDDPVFNRATINLSQVKYDDVPDSAALSATAISVIMHPRNPFAPSMHFHMSYIEMRGKEPFWRMIADLNPSIENPEDTAKFESVLRSVVPGKLYTDAKDFGDKYFDIPQLGRTRGVTHMFIAKLDPGSEMSPTKCVELAKQLGERVIDAYSGFVQAALQAHPEGSITSSDRETQMAYHTLYLFQVLMLDRGTTAGLLAHSDNDVGTLGSLPNVVDSGLLTSWLSKVSPDTDHDVLLKRIVDALPGEGQGHSDVNSDTRGALANVVRNYYKEDMKRVSKQASMDMEWWAKLTEKRLAEAR